MKPAEDCGLNEIDEASVSRIRSSRPGFESQLCINRNLLTTAKSLFSRVCQHVHIAGAPALYPNVKAEAETRERFRMMGVNASFLSYLTRPQSGGRVYEVTNCSRRSVSFDT